MALCLWQLSGPSGATALSWAYVFEWPFFAGLRHLHVVAPRPRGAREHVAGRRRRRMRRRPGPRPPPPDRRPSRPQEQEEDAELAAYNEYLAQLAERDKATGR